MRQFEYADEKISDNELMIAIPSVTIGVGVLSLPSLIAENTIGSDGWIPILGAGILFVSITWLIVKVASMYPNQPFISFASLLVSKPIATILTILLALQGVFITGFVLRIIADIAKEYLFDRTPLEVISLSFLLVVCYAVSGSRAGLFRLNMMFFPIIIFIIVFVGIFSTNWYDATNFLPVFQTDIQGYAGAMKNSIFSLTGLFILFFYTSLVRKPDKAPKKAAYGMTMVPIFYIFIYFMCIGVFGYAGTANVNYPIIEIAKEIEIPGGFFERFDSIFFVIWMMAVFNTVTMAFDSSLYALKSVFNLKKMHYILVLTPMLFFVAMTPEDVMDVQKFGDFVSIYGLVITTLTAVVLFIIASVKKKTSSEASKRRNSKS
ncbi:GerAB/ArcD/ProY family transporter [Virgibacillus dokdonensis]|uniref:Spore germination protein YndE n=1 Tax=Virgibacillus dokdonensis TaxID=302167 RepID=A0A2K9IZX5_9BACI|nr:endospore germination permease [Virgibacillus dokdonensis]AUJ25272.1 Spore germination protein YndE [Virgibacillus dokdonensis]